MVNTPAEVLALKLKEALLEEPDGSAYMICDRSPEFFLVDGTVNLVDVAEILLKKGVVVNQVPQAFIDGILHGDDNHRRWLQEAADAFNAGLPPPQPY